MKPVIIAVVVVLTLGIGRVGTTDQRTDPWSLVVLFDVSVSMRLDPGRSEALLAGARDALERPLRPDQQVRIGAFASEIRFPLAVPDPGASTQELERALSGDPEWRYGPSRIWDAVEAASLAIASDPGRRVVLLVTDGRASGNRLSRDDVTTKLRERNVELWLFSLRNSPVAHRMRAFVRERGGLVFFAIPPNASVLRTTLRDVLTQCLGALETPRSTGW